MIHDKSLLIAAVAMGSIFISSLIGCTNRNELNALRAEAMRLQAQADANRSSIDSAITTYNECQTNLAQITGQAPLTTPNETAVPVIISDSATKEELQQAQQSLTTIVAQQQARLTEVQSSVTQCQAQLETARNEPAKPGDATNPSQNTREKAGRENAGNDTPAAVKNAEESGQPTSGVRSRYKTKASPTPTNP